MRSSRSSNVLSFVISSFAVGLILACGSTPKPDTNTATTPSATPATPDMADASSGGTAETGDGGGGAPDAGPTKEQQCEAIVHDAQAELDAEHIKVDTACKKDADCILVKGHPCDFVCTDGAIPKAEKKEWDREMAQVKAGPCQKYADMGCKAADAKPPTCTDEKKKAACDKGHCVLR
jgi:hypothetical protein